MTDTSTVLITGGARSGKSSYAQQLAERLPGPRLYLATAEVRDQEMAARVARHRQERGREWDATREEPLELLAALRQVASDYRVVLVDCLTLWLTNLFFARRENQDEVLQEVAHLARYLPSCPTRLIMVTNELGLGIVPENPLARKFRDLAGRSNQLLAAACREVYLVCCGLPLKLK